MCVSKISFFMYYELEYALYKVWTRNLDLKLLVSFKRSLCLKVPSHQTEARQSEQGLTLIV